MDSTASEVASGAAPLSSEAFKVVKKRGEMPEEEAATGSTEDVMGLAKAAETEKV